MQLFSSGREAKDYLIAQIVAEAQLERVPLSETERKMMYFTETAWTLPEIEEVREDFERDYDQTEYEAKIGELASRARARAGKTTGLDRWKEAVGVLEGEDHYLLILLGTSGSSDSVLVDRVKLVATAFLVCAVLIAAIFLFEAMK